uniref:Putative group iv salivary lipocalin n=1 Tax=Rhipicephalus pulchellus TaxID=72859 RepID=L7MBT9_RHIPC
MAPCNFWLFVLIPIVIPQHSAAFSKVVSSAAKYVPKKSHPYMFMLNSPMYLYLTTRGLPGVACIKAIKTTANLAARTLTQLLVFKSLRSGYDYEYVHYKPICKHKKPVRGFASFNNNTREKTTYTLRHIYQDCAIVNKTTNTKTGGYREACELWVNDQFFGRNLDGLKFCITNFWNYCKPNDTVKQYLISYCEEKPGKLILVS